MGLDSLHPGTRWSLRVAVVAAVVAILAGDAPILFAIMVAPGSLLIRLG